MSSTDYGLIVSSKSPAIIEAELRANSLIRRFFAAIIRTKRGIFHLGGKKPPSSAALHAAFMMDALESASNLITLIYRFSQDVRVIEDLLHMYISWEQNLKYDGSMSID